MNAKGFLAALSLVLTASPTLADQKFTVYPLISQDLHFGDPGPGGGVLINDDVQDEAGAPVGNVAGVCVQLDAGGNFACNLVLDITDHGLITLSGKQVPPPDKTTLVITGGTGDYGSAAGSVQSTLIENGTRIKFVVSLLRRAHGG